MYTLATRTLVSAASLMLCCTTLQADDLRFSDVERRLAALEAQTAAKQGVQTAAHLSCSDGEPAACDGTCCNAASCDGGCCDGGCQPCAGCDVCSNNYCGRFYGEIQLLWVRPHVSEDWIGKLSESHDFAPRYVLGYEDRCGLGGRVRYWRYDDEVDVLWTEDSIAFQLDVLDVEVTNRFQLCRTDIVLAGGFRYAGWDLRCYDNGVVDIDAYGLTMAADLSTLVCCHGCNRWSFVYGGRLSILGGDWEGDNALIDTIPGYPGVRDDSLLVHELYAGVEYAYCHCEYDLYMRAVFEMQNWRSDVLSEPGIGTGLADYSVGSTSSIGFYGPSLQFGVRY
jgi:hypothetical protein